MKPRDILRRHATVLMRKLGYNGSYPHFRKVADNRVELITFQIDKYGRPRFVVELAAAPRGDFVTYWGAVIPEKKLTAWDLAERYRLGSDRPGDDYWFVVDDQIEETMSNIERLLLDRGRSYFEKVVP